MHPTGIKWFIWADSCLDVLRSTPRLLKLAFLCGVLPLLLGTLVFLTWLATRWNWLMAAGILVIILGLTWFLMGIISLALHLYRTNRIPVAERRQQNWLALISVCLLLANFPAAYFYAVKASDISTRYTLIVINESGHLVESLLITAPGVNRKMDPLPTGAQAINHFHFFGDGQLKFSLPSTTQPAEGTIQGYVTGSIGGKKVLRLKPDGAYTIDAE